MYSLPLKQKVFEMNLAVTDIRWQTVVVVTAVNKKHSSQILGEGLAPPV